MGTIQINIDGIEISTYEGRLLVEVAREYGVEIPTLCHDPRVKAYGSCGVCVVELVGSPKLIRACSTIIQQGMVVRTYSERIFSTRQAALELLLSDHVGDCRPPCVTACPGHTDCQGYVGLVAIGQYDEALKLVKDKIPLPGTIGRVCPHPCETACRRGLVEEPISIAGIKAFLGNHDMQQNSMYTPEVREDTGKKVAVVGGGPGGLAAAYFLRQKGHAVEVFDKMPQMGGMLYYGIPEYRLPKDYLSMEVNTIADMGAIFHNNVLVGRDTTLEALRGTFDAVVLATGAWKSSPMAVPGADLEGVVGGIDFLRCVVTATPQNIGPRVAIVGGGNTAMDACRTAVRLGAKEVYNIYRRTKDQMPAEQIEIKEAEEEGVIFKELTNPLEFVGEGGRVNGIRLQQMELGEPDASGRCSPRPIPGGEELLEVDTVIIAIGQQPDTFGLDGVQMTAKNTIFADEQTFATNLPGVFAIGDATNKGADIAIAAIGEADRAVGVIDSFLYGQEVPFKEPYIVTQEVTAEMFVDRPKAARVPMRHRTAENRKNNFLEVNAGYSVEEAMAEAARCMECGCHDFFECKLVAIANQYDVHPEKYAGGEVHRRSVADSHPFIRRNPDKCILCGLCVRICAEVVGETALGLVGRGFDTVVAPALELPLAQSGCISCGQCVAVCPTGALMEVMQADKQIPVAEEKTVTTCSFCSVGCQQELTTTGSQIWRALPYNEEPDRALLCAKGRFGFGEISHATRLTEYVRAQDGEVLTLREAMVYLTKSLQALQSVWGQDSVALAISSRYTSEEIYLVREYAHRILGTDLVFSFGEPCSGILPVLGEDRSTVTLREMEQTQCILMVEMDIERPHLIAGLSVKKAVENGAELILLHQNANSIFAADYATKAYETEDTLELLTQVLKAVVDATPNTMLEGYTELVTQLEGMNVSAKAAEIAQRYLNAKTAVILFEQGKISPQAATVLANIAVVAGKAFAPRSGIIQMKPGANSQGLSDLGIRPYECLDIQEVKGLVVFGENPPAAMLPPELAFLAVHDLHKTALAAQADLLLPARSYAEVSGNFTNAVGGRGEVRPATESPLPTLLEYLTTAARVQEQELPWQTEAELEADCAAAMALHEVLPVQLQPVDTTASLRRVFVHTNALSVSLGGRLS